MTEIKGNSPFQKRGMSDKPKLRFLKPEETENWFLSQEKTDYTYSRSASYSHNRSQAGNLQEVSDGYDMPIMSRRSYTRSYVPSTPDRRLPPRDPTTSARRRSTRIAAKHGIQLYQSQDHADVSTQLPSQSQSRTSFYSRTTVDTYDSSSRPSNVNIPDSVYGSKSRNLAASASRLSNQSGLFSEENYSSNEHSLTHLYGLDDDSSQEELSDTESSQSRSSRRTNWSGASSSWIPHRRINISSIITTIITSTITVITYLPKLVIQRFASEDSRRKSLSETPFKSSDTNVRAISSYAHSTSHVVYKLVTNLLLTDVWLLTAARHLLISSWSGSAVGSRGLYSNGTTLSHAGIASTSSASLRQSAVREEIRRRTKSGAIPCWCLLFLILLPFLLPLLFYGWIPFLLPIAKNETNETMVYESLTTVPIESVPLAGGCSDCWSRESILALIAISVRESTSALRNDLQDQRALLSERSKQQESEIIFLKSQLEQLSAKPATVAEDSITSLTIIVDLEKQISDLKNDFRTLRHSAISDKETLTKDQDNYQQSIVFMKSDVSSFKEQVNTLSEAFEDFRKKHQSLETSTQWSSQQSLSDLRANVLTQKEVIQSELGSLEAKLSDLETTILLLESSSGKNQVAISELVSQVNTLESDMTSLKASLRQLNTDLLKWKSEESPEEKELVSLMQVKLETQKHDFKLLEDLVLSEKNKVKNLSAEFVVLKNDVVVVKSRGSEIEINVADSKNKLDALSERTSATDVNLSAFMASTSENEKKIVEDMERTHESIQGDVDFLKEEVGSNTNIIALLEPALFQMKSNMEGIEGKVNSNSESLRILEAGFIALQNALNGSDLFDLSKSSSLLIVKNYNNFESELRTLKSQVDSLQGFQISDNVEGSSLEQILSQFAELNTITSKLTQQLDRTTQTVGVFSKDLAYIHGKIEDLEAQTANEFGMPIQFVDIQASLDAAKTDILDLKDSVGSVLQDLNENQVMLEVVSADNKHVQSQLSPGGTLVNLISMHSNVQSLHTELEDFKDSLSVLKADLVSQEKQLGLLITENEEQEVALGSFSNFDLDITNLRTQLSNLQRGNTDQEGIQKSDVAAVAGLADLELKVNNLEASLTSIQKSQESKGAQFQTGLLGLQREIADLREDMEQMRKKEQRTEDSTLGAAGLGLAGMAGLMSEDEVNDLRANLTKLNDQYSQLYVDLNGCCNNKSAIAAAWGAGHPLFGFAGGASEESGDVERIRHIILGALDMYNADKVGMVDYALESAGGGVISTRCSETYTSKTALFSILGIPLWYMSNSPRTVIQPDVHPGNCWAFRGAVGYLVIKLADVIQTTAFTLEHIPKALSPTGNITSAPKNFSVWGLKDEYDTDGALLGEFMYDDDGPALQVFPVQNEEAEPTGLIELQIESNYGNLEYTCVYRFRVHGKLPQK